MRIVNTRKPGGRMRFLLRGRVSHGVGCDLARGSWIRGSPVSTSRPPAGLPRSGESAARPVGTVAIGCGAFEALSTFWPVEWVYVEGGLIPNGQQLVELLIFGA